MVHSGPGSYSKGGIDEQIVAEAGSNALKASLQDRVAFYQLAAADGAFIAFEPRSFLSWFLPVGCSMSSATTQPAMTHSVSMPALVRPAQQRTVEQPATVR